MKINTSLPAHDLNAVGSAAKTIEEQGFSGVSTQENRQDAFLPLAVAATQTESLELRTNIAIAFARSPMVAANMSWDIQRASKGRFTLGIGSQVKGHNVRRFSVPWSPPAPRMREYVQSLRAIWDCWANGTKLDYKGEHYQFSLMTPNFTPEPCEQGVPKVQIAAVGPGDDEGGRRGVRWRDAARVLHRQISGRSHLASFGQGPRNLRARPRRF
jgi:probable F420-dependent oxidoreductase